MMSLLISERPAESRKAESDSDSGVGSPMEETVTDSTVPVEAPGDSDDEITVHRKSRSRKVLQDSDSEKEEEEVAELGEALILSESSREDAKASEGEQLKKRKSRTAVDSGESETEKDEGQGKSKQEKNKREKSQRRKEKAKRRNALVKRLKEKSATEEASLPKAFNDSGCLLGDNDLFDAQLEDGTADGEMEEEESLDAIRDAVKQKAKNKPLLHDSEEDEEQEGKMQRKERKAAKASKEAMKQLHSDSQRLVRESAIGLPYYMPEPKSIDQFFKRKAHLEGSAMALLKSTKYQPPILETFAAAPTKQCPSNPPKQCSDSSVEIGLNGPNSGSSIRPENTTDKGEIQPATEPTNDQLRTELNTDHPNPNLDKEEDGVAAVLEVSEGGAHEEALVPVKQAESGPEPPVQTESTIAEPCPAVPKPRKDKLARLRELGLDPPPVAKLCADDGAFVQLEPPQTNPALEALKERFLRHVQPAPRPKGERTLQLSVVRKDSAPSGQEELRAESITVTVNEGEEKPVHAKPGEKLVLLKTRLQKAMAVRRQEERERRAALYRLDNEDCEEEEEEEMTESEDEEGVGELLGDGEDEEGDLGEDEDKGETGEEVIDESERRNALKDSSSGFKSPSPTPDNDGTLMLFAGNSCSRTGDGVRQSGHAGQENYIKTEDEDALSLTKDNSHNSSFELIGSMLPSYQPVRRAAGRGLSAGAFRSPSPCFFRPSFLGSASKSSGKLSEPSLTLPVEDSQDLYALPSPGEVGPLGVGDSQGPFSLEEDTHSQLLDADGFLNVGPRGGPSRSHKRQLLLDNLDENAMDANMGELLGLCSGGFGSGRSQPGATQSGAEDELLGLCSGAFTTQPGEAAGEVQEEITTLELESREASHKSSSGDVDELLALCSGASPIRSLSSPALEDTSGGKLKKQEEEEEEEEEEDHCEFRLLSDVDSLSEKEEDEEASDVEGTENDGEVDEEEDEEREAVFGQRSGKRKIRLTEFVDSEAELSGSDMGSEDEEEDGGDEYEEEELQEELPSDEELMDQVNKIHMKQVLDDDKKKLRLYQERYLADGDLHSDGPGRERRFRWRNVDDDFEFGIDAVGEEEEEEEELDQNELQRRKERLEREQWLREKSEAQADKGEDQEDEKIGEEDSQFMKLAKKLTAKTLQKREIPSVPQQEKTAPNINPFQKPAPVVKRGSLLSQPRAVLQKLANISDGNPLAPRNTRGFLFQTLSPEKEPPASAGPKKQVKKRSPTESLGPAAKRQCQENSKSSGPPRSIFSYLEN